MTGGVESLKDYAIKRGENQPEAFKAWIEELKKKGQTREVLEAAKEGIKIISKDCPYRSEIAEYIIDIGHEINDDKLILEGCREAFYSNPSVYYFVKLYNAAEKMNMVKYEVKYALKRLEEGISQIKHSRKNNREEYVDNYFPNLSVNLLNQVYILAGEYKKTYSLCNNKKSLGWSRGNNPKGITVPYLLFLIGVKFSGSQSSAIENTRSELEKSFENSLTNTRDMAIKESLLDIIEKNASKVIENIDEQETLLLIKWCKNEISKRIDGIVSNKYRGSYYKAAGILVAMNDVLNISNQNDYEDAFLKHYMNKYSIYSAFRREVKEKLGIK